MACRQREKITGMSFVIMWSTFVALQDHFTIRSQCVCNWLQLKMTPFFAWMNVNLAECFTVGCFMSAKRELQQEKNF